MGARQWKHSLGKQITGDREHKSKKRSGSRAVARPRASVGFELSASDLRLFSNPSEDCQGTGNGVRPQCFPARSQGAVNPDPTMPRGWGKRLTGCKNARNTLRWFPGCYGNRWGRAGSFPLGRGGKKKNQ